MLGAFIQTDDELEAIDLAIAAVQAALSALREARGELLAPPVAALLEEGSVRDALVDWAEANRADVLVCGSRGLGGTLKRAVLGSVSSYLMQHAPCAVLIVSAPVLKALVRDAQREAEEDTLAQGMAAATAEDSAAAAAAAAAQAEPQEQQRE